VINFVQIPFAYYFSGALIIVAMTTFGRNDDQGPFWKKVNDLHASP